MYVHGLNKRESIGNGLVDPSICMDVTLKANNTQQIEIEPHENQCDGFQKAP